MTPPPYEKSVILKTLIREHLQNHPLQNIDSKDVAGKYLIPEEFIS
jgi:hypothetical protein